MAVLCRDMHADGGTRRHRRGRRGLGFACSICRFDCQLSCGCRYIWIGWLPGCQLGLVGLRFITLWLAFYLSWRRRRPRKCWQRHCAFRSLACASAIQFLSIFSYFPAIFFFYFFLICFFLLFCHCAGRTQPQHINFRTDIGQPFLQPVDAVWPPVRPVQQALHGRVHFLHALLWSVRVPFLLAWAASAAVMWCRLIEIGAWTSWATATVFVWLCVCRWVCVCVYACMYDTRINSSIMNKCAMKDIRWR